MKNEICHILGQLNTMLYNSCIRPRVSLMSSKAKLMLTRLLN